MEGWCWRAGSGKRGDSEENASSRRRSASALIEEVADDVNGVERDPAAAEDEHHADEHAVRAPLASDLGEVALAQHLRPQRAEPVRVARHRRLVGQHGARRVHQAPSAQPVAQHERDARVAVGDDRTRRHELQHEAARANTHNNVLTPLPLPRQRSLIRRERRLQTARRRRTHAGHTHTYTDEYTARTVPGHCEDAARVDVGPLLLT